MDHGGMDHGGMGGGMEMFDGWCALQVQRERVMLTFGLIDTARCACYGTQTTSRPALSIQVNLTISTPQLLG
jgi:hypothetical protein